MKYNNEDLLIAAIFSDKIKLFILWMIHKKKLNYQNDLGKNYTNSILMNEALEELILLECVQNQLGNLTLSPLAEKIVDEFAIYGRDVADSNTQHEHADQLRSNSEYKEFNNKVAPSNWRRNRRLITLVQKVDHPNRSIRQSTINSLATMKFELNSWLRNSDENVRIAAIHIISSITFRGSSFPFLSIASALVQLLDDVNEEVKDQAKQILKSKMVDLSLLLDADNVENRNLAYNALREMVPLLCSWLCDDNWIVRDTAAFILGKVYDSDLTEILSISKNLKSNDKIIRNEANNAVERQLKVLIPRLQHKETNTRIITAYALGVLAARSAAAISELTRLLRDENTNVRHVTANVLGLIGSTAGEATSELVRLLRDDDVKVRIATVVTLGRIGRAASKAIPELALLVQDDVRVRIATAKTLGQIAPSASPAQAALVRLLQDGDLEVRVAAVETLGQIGPAASPTTAELARLLWDEDVTVRVATIEALGQIGQHASAAIPELGRLLQEKQNSTYKKTIEALEEITENNPTFIINMLNNDDYNTRIASAHLLARIFPPILMAVPSLAHRLRDSDVRVQKAAEHALKAMGSEVVPYLAHQSEDKDPQVRFETALALGYLGFKAIGAVPELISLLIDDEARIREAATYALIVMLPELVRRLGDERSSTRLIAAETLGRIGPLASEAIPELTRLLNDDNVKVRSAAAYALKLIGTRIG